MFESAGFTNIELVELDDVIFGIIAHDGEVESVTINGDDDFYQSSWFPSDALIKITYHSKK